VLGRLSFEQPPGAVLVAADTRDDAAVIDLGDGRALVQTVDFFTPIVDDPFDWGRIGAANCFSDVYAMGGRPAFALNLVAWPVQELPLELLSSVLEGAAKVAAEAGVAILGGHSIHDPEPKYGMAVTGFVDPDRLVRNSTAPRGARLVLTKPLGTGIITTALKRGMADAQTLGGAVDAMTALNAPASEAMVEAGAAAATDVTGYGLLGHLHFMLAASGVAAEIRADAVPLLPGTAALAADGVIPGGTRSNHDFLRPRVDWGELDEASQLVLSDAQTSGGLLIAVEESRAGALRDALNARGVTGAEIGTVRAGPPGRIAVRGRLGGEIPSL
jgi:selenide, water dikinase